MNEGQEIPPTPNANEVRIHIEAATQDDSEAERAEEIRRHQLVQAELLREREDINRLYDDSAINRRPTAQVAQGHGMLSHSGGPMSIQELQGSRYGLPRMGLRPAFERQQSPYGQARTTYQTPGGPQIGYSTPQAHIPVNAPAVGNGFGAGQQDLMRQQLDFMQRQMAQQQQEFAMQQQQMQQQMQQMHSLMVQRFPQPTAFPQSPVVPPVAPHTPYMVPTPAAMQPGAVVHQQEIPKLPRHQGVGDKADKKTWVLYQSYLQKIAHSSTAMHQLVPMPISQMMDLDQRVFYAKYRLNMQPMDVTEEHWQTYFRLAYEKVVVKVSEMQDLIKAEVKMVTGNCSATDVVAKWQKSMFDLLTTHDFISMPEKHPKEYISALMETIMPYDLRQFLKSEYLGDFKLHNKDVAMFFGKVEMELTNRLKFMKKGFVPDPGSDNARQMKALQEEVRTLRAAAHTTNRHDKSGKTDNTRKSDDSATHARDPE